MALDEFSEKEMKKENKMGIQNILSAVFIALGFSAWGIIGRFTGASGPWVGVAIITSTVVPVVLYSWNKLASSIPSVMALVCLCIAGVINGIAFQVNSNKMADPNISAGAFLAMMYVMMVVIAPLLDWGFNKTIPSVSQFFGFFLAAIAVYFLSR